MTTAESIHRRLTEHLAPEVLEVIDESHLHAGHAGARPGGETHFRVVIVSAGFVGQSRLARQRQIMDLLRDELAGGVHALSIAAMTPEEAASR